MATTRGAPPSGVRSSPRAFKRQCAACSCAVPEVVRVLEGLVTSQLPEQLTGLAQSAPVDASDQPIVVEIPAHDQTGASQFGLCRPFGTTTRASPLGRPKVLSKTPKWCT